MGNVLQTMLIVLLLAIVVSVCSSQECKLLSTCSECITQNSSCAWCNDENIFNEYASDISQQLTPAVLCGTIDELTDIGCNNVYNPIGVVDMPITQDTDDFGSGEIPITIQSNVVPDLVTAILRPGVKETINITVSPPESISVDMYVLMDLSFTMNDDLNRLREFGEELVQLMQDLTNEFRIGFGSFVDKPVEPFVGRENRDTPCNLEVEQIASQCIPTYAFKHHLDFTSNASRFTEELNNASISGSEDHPESLFDALLQLSVCEDIIGWRPVGTARRIVLTMTDGDYHTALDGRLAGILDKPTAECKLNPITNVYDDADKVDYPSSTFIADILNENRITPIFAARDTFKPVYDDLRRIIESAFIGEISDRSSNLLSLISEQYTALSTTVIPLINGVNDNSKLIVQATPINQCGAGTVSNTRADTCENVTFPNNVMYELTLEALPSFCDESDSQTIHSIQILFIGFGDTTINISVQCSCPCEMDRVEDSSICSGNGDYECSTCICDDNYVGTTCDCVTGVTSVFGCRSGGNDSTICSGRGDCICNECKCNSVPTLANHVFQGRYCECDPFACSFGANDNGNIVPCSDHGTCGCNGQCICDIGYSGLSCECPSNVATCKREGEEEECSGVGQCRCGVCVCDDYSERRGQYCEECVNCRGSCSILRDCVDCLISDTCIDQSCDNVTLTHMLEAIPNYNSSNFVFRNCSVANSNCEVIYQIDQNVVGLGEMVSVYINNNQISFNRWRESPGDCEPAPNVLIYVIPVCIVVVIIIIAIVALAGWKIITVITEYSEYKTWERSQMRETWNASKENPLFVAATTEHTNPKYRRPVQFVDTY